MSVLKKEFVIASMLMLTSVGSYALSHHDKVAYAIENEGVSVHYTEKVTTVAEALKAQGIEVDAHDEVTPALTTPMKDDIKIQVKQAKKINLKMGGLTTVVYTTADTVAEFLKKEKITLSANDKVSVNLTEAIEEGQTIQITRVVIKEMTENKSIEFETTKKEDNTLAKGETKISQEGQPGEMQQTFKVIYEDDKQVDKHLLSEKVIKNPVSKIELIGTKENNQSTTSNAENTSVSGRQVTVEATAYGADCEGCSGVTATGIALSGGARVIAVDPSVIPLGSRVYVPGYGEAIAGDTGGAIQGNIIDVFMGTEAAASSWGRQTITVTILD